MDKKMLSPLTPLDFRSAYVRRASLASEVLLQGKRRVQILCALRPGPVRPGHLGRLIPGVSKKVLAHNLRKLEADGIIVRKDLSDLVLHIEYDLNAQTGESIEDLLDHLVRWGQFYIGHDASDPNRGREE